MDKIINEVKEFNLYSCDEKFTINNKEIIFCIVKNNYDYFSEYVNLIFKNEAAKKQYLNTFESLFIMIINNTLFLLPKNDYYNKLEMCVMLS